MTIDTTFQKELGARIPLSVYLIQIDKLGRSGGFFEEAFAQQWDTIS